MRQHKILTRTLLILSIINFVLAAPATIRQRPKILPDANTSNVKASLQKRWDPEDGSTNLPGPDHAPPLTPDSTFWSQIMGIAQQYGHTDSPLHSQYSPESGLDNAPPNPGPPTGPRLPVGSIPVAGALAPPASPGQPGLSDDRYPPGFHPSDLSVNRGKLLSTGNQPTPPQTAAQDLVTPPAPSPEDLPNEFWDELSKGPVTPPVPSPEALPKQPNELSNGLSKGPVTLPAPSPEALPDEFWDGLSKGPDTPPPLSPEPLPDEFWDDLWKGRIKRRISGSVVQRDPRSIKYFFNFGDLPQLKL